MQNNFIFDESPDKTERRIERKNPSIRFLVEITDFNLLSLDPRKLDASFKN